MDITISSDGETVVSGDNNGIIYFWNLYTGEKLQVLKAHSGYIYSLTNVPNSNLIISSGSDGIIKVWNIQNAELLHAYNMTGDRVYTLSVTPDGRKLVVGSSRKYYGYPDSVDKNFIRVFDIKNKKQLSVRMEYDDFTAMAISPDGQHYVSGSRDYCIKIRDIVTHKLIKRIESHGYIHSLAFAPDGKCFVSGHGNSYHMAVLWDSHGEMIRTLIGHSDVVTSVSISHDNKKIITGSDDKTIKIWDLKDGSEQFTLTGHSNGVRTLVLTPDGKSIISGSVDGTIRLWNIENGQEHVSFFDY